MTQSLRPYLPAAAVLLVTLVAYGNTLQNGFAMNDRYNVVDNQQIRSLKTVPTLFARAWGPRRNDRVYYRPLTALSLAIDHQLWGLRPAGYHLTNTLVHALAALLLLGLLRRLMPGSPGGAMAGALLFALHPIQTEAVNLVSYRADLLAGLFVIVGLRAFVGQRPPWQQSVLVTLAYALGLASKESAIVLPAMVFAAWLLPLAIAQGDRWRRALIIFTPLLALAVGYLLLRNALLSPAGGDYFAGATSATKVFTVLGFFHFYASTILWPWPLLPFYDWLVFPFARSPLSGPAIAGLFILTATFFIILSQWRKRPLISLSILWFLCGIVPTLHIVAIPISVAERFVYIPMVGVALGLALLFAAAVKRHQLVSWIIALALLAAMFTAVVVRNSHWSSDETLWRRATIDYPQSFNAHLTLGKIYRGQRKYDAALASFRRAESLMPKMEVTASWIAGTLLEAGRRKEACDYLRRTMSQLGSTKALKSLARPCPGITTGTTSAPTK